MKKILFFISIITALTSCSKFLDQEPISSSTDNSFWKNEQDANAAVAAGYSLLRDAFNWAEGATFYAYGDLPSDEFISAQGQDWPQIASMSWSLPVPSAEVWRRMRRMRRYDIFYRSIDEANRCLKFIPGIPLDKFSSEEIKNNLLGEAYFIRAFNYFYMSRVWGDVPLVTESANVTEAKDLTRTAQQQVLNQCIKDLEAAIPLLSWEYPSDVNKAVRANKGAAYALLAHIYAWMGDYGKCAAATESVISSGVYAYTGRDSVSYLSIYKGQSSEGIFEIAQSGQNEGTGLGIGYYTLQEPYLKNKTNVDFPLDITTINRFFPADATDLRRTSAFDLSNSTSPLCIKYANVTYTSSTQTQAGTAIFRNNIIIFRYSDIKLLRAEALAATGNPGPARAILNEVRSKAQAEPWTGNDADLFEAIIDERGRELFLEGHRFYDLIRLMRKTGINKFNGKISDSQFSAGKYYWPLDPTLLNQNKLLIQTPFWSASI